MTTILLVIHLLIAIALVITVLLQPSEGGGLGIGGGGGGGSAGLGGFLSGRGTANLLTRTTAILAACFMVTSVILTIFSGAGEQRSILDELPAQSAPSQEAPGAAPSAPESGSQTTPEAEVPGPGDGSEGGPEVPVQ